MGRGAVAASLKLESKEGSSPGARSRVSGGAPQALSRCVGRGQEDHGEGMMGAELKLETSPDFVRKSEGTNSAFSLVRHPCVSMWASGRGLRG